jgi:hypothetical protein
LFLKLQNGKVKLKAATTELLDARHSRQFCACVGVEAAGLL